MYPKHGRKVRHSFTGITAEGIAVGQRTAVALGGGHLVSAVESERHSDLARASERAAVFPDSLCYATVML